VNPMARILLQTTIPAHPDDWDITRFSLLADELRAAGFEVIARNRANRGDDDPVLSHVDELGYDQLWLMAVDVGDGLTAADAYAIRRFREHGGGVLTARDHEDLGCCLSRLGSLGVVNEFHDKNVDPATMCDDQDTPTISWPNYHSGANGDYQPVLIEGPVHDLLQTRKNASGRIEWSRRTRTRAWCRRTFPSPPHSRRAGAPQPAATSTSPFCSTERSRRMADRWAGRSPNQRSTISPTTTGISIAGHHHSSPSRRAQKSRPTRPVWRYSRTTSETSRPGCSRQPVAAL
jgi:hypothetical protein